MKIILDLIIDMQENFIIDEVAKRWSALIVFLAISLLFRNVLIVVDLL